MLLFFCLFICFFFKQKTAYEMRISDWSSDVCSSDLLCETLERYRYIVRSLLIPTDRLDKSFLLNETGLRRIAGERELPFQLSKLCLQGLQLVVEFGDIRERSEEHTSELQSLMRISYAVFCLKKKTKK